MKYIRDSLYGNISISESQQRVIDTKEVQRLRRLKQLGLSSLIYPGATHSRFEHSLGVMHLAGELAEMVGLDEETVELYKFAGLLHDTGHGPFSHASERVIKQYTGKSHEDYSCEVINELDGVLPVPADDIIDIILGESKYNIVNGTIDVDRMDYLRRDASRTGVEHGTIDTNTILQFATAANGQLAFNRKAVPALESLLMSRFHMQKAVYSHHTSLIAEDMLEKALDEYVENNSISEVIYTDDYEMHSKLLNSSGIPNQLYSKLLNRELYKVAYNNPLGEKLEKQKLKTVSNKFDIDTLEEAIAEEVGCQNHQIIVNGPHLPKDDKTDVQIKLKTSVTGLSDVSPFPKTIKEYQWQTTNIQVYSPPQLRKNVHSVCSEVIPDLIEEI